jgi:hypothetical protein
MTTAQNLSKPWRLRWLDRSDTGFLIFMGGMIAIWAAGLTGWPALLVFAGVWSLAWRSEKASHEHRLNQRRQRSSP